MTVTIQTTKDLVILKLPYVKYLATTLLKLMEKVQVIFLLKAL